MGAQTSAQQALISPSLTAGIRERRSLHRPCMGNPESSADLERQLGKGHHRSRRDDVIPQYNRSTPPVQWSIVGRMSVMTSVRAVSRRRTKQQESQSPVRSRRSSTARYLAPAVNAPAANRAWNTQGPEIDSRSRQSHPASMRAMKYRLIVPEGVNFGSSVSRRCDTLPPNTTARRVVLRTLAETAVRRGSGQHLRCTSSIDAMNKLRDGKKISPDPPLIRSP